MSRVETSSKDYNAPILSALAIHQTRESGKRLELDNKSVWLPGPTAPILLAVVEEESIQLASSKWHPRAKLIRLTRVGPETGHFLIPLEGI